MRTTTTRPRGGTGTAALPEEREDDLDPVASGTDDLRAVCHDLRGHLATIGMIANALRASAAAETALGPRLDVLLDEVAQSSEMVRRVLSGRRETAPLDLAALTRDVVTRAALTAACPLRCLVEPAIVVADPIQLSRLLANLIDNAVRAAGPHGTVAVSVQRRVKGCAEDVSVERPPDHKRARAVLTVADSGPGFGRAAPGAASLGLRIVRSVLAEVGGQYAVGRSPLGGCLVTVTLPLSEG